MIKKYAKTVCLFSLPFLLLNCSAGKLHKDFDNNLSEMRRILAEGAQKPQAPDHDQQTMVPSSISDILIKPENGGTATVEQDRFDVIVNSVPAANFFSALSNTYARSIVVSPEIKESITLNMKDVTINEVLEALRKIYYYEFEKTSYGYNVYLPRIETRIFTINHLDIEREGSTMVSINPTSSSQGNSNSSGNRSGGTNRSGSSNQSGGSGKSTSSVNTKTASDFWGKLESTLKNLAAIPNARMKNRNDKPSVKINPDSGVIVIRSYPQQLREIALFLESTQKASQRQVIIETKILDIALNEQYASGIDWDAAGIATFGGRTKGRWGLQSGELKTSAYNGLDQNKFQFGFLKGATGAAGDAAVGDFKSMISLLASQGQISVLSSPRVSTLNNQKAVIKVGEDRFFVTGVSNTTQNVAGGNTQRSNLRLASFFSGIALDVTPQISSDGHITLHMHPVVSRVTKDVVNVTVDGKDSALPMAKVIVRETDTIVKARNKQVIIIGGLMENEVATGKSGPDIDGIRDALGHHNSHKGNSELVILLRPVIVEGSTWSDELNLMAQQSVTTQKVSK